MLGIIVIVPLSYLFFLICEKPFMKLGKKMSVPKTETTAVVNSAP